MPKQVIGGDATASPPGVSHNVGGDTETHQGNTQANMEQGSETRPSWLPEGINTPEELSAAYGKLVGDKSAPSMPAAGGDDTLKDGQGDDSLTGSEGDDKDGAEEDANKDKPAFDAEATKKALKEAGGIYADPRYEPYALAFEEHGELTAEQITAAAKDFGVPENAVADFIAGQKAMRQEAAEAPTRAQAAVQAQVDQVFKTAGLDQETYSGPFSEWANENLDEAQLATYNKALDKDPNAAALILKGWADRFKADTRTPRDATTSTRQGDGGGSQGAKPFANMSEQLAAQNDRRYKDDPSFRKDVERRIHASTYGS